MGISRNFSAALALLAVTSVPAFAESSSAPVPPAYGSTFDLPGQVIGEDNCYSVADLAGSNFNFPGQVVGADACYPAENGQKESTVELGLYA